MASHHAATIAALFLALTSTSLIAAVSAYKNYTVGDADGWFFNVDKNTTSADYTAWASDKTFSLGDYLIFNTNVNSSVIQTFNETTYKLCDPSDDNAHNTVIYYDPDGPYQYSVPLVEADVQYFFSGASDGVQCFQGMKFSITVEKGQGLPPSLNHPPPPPYVDPSPPPEAPEKPSSGGSGQEETFYNGASVTPARLGFGASMSIVGVLCLLF